MFDIVVCEFSVIFAQIELIADPYRVAIWIAGTYVGIKKNMSQMQTSHRRKRTTQNSNLCSTRKVHRTSL